MQKLLISGLFIEFYTLTYGNGNNVIIERLKSIRKCSKALLQCIKKLKT